MNRAVVFVTSQMPFGHGEIWGIAEARALLAAGVRLIIVPRTASGGVLHSDAEPLLSHTLAAGLVSTSAMHAAGATALCRARQLREVLGWTRAQSNSVAEFAKGLCVLPKALDVARQLRGQDVGHVHAYSTTSVAVLGYTLARMLGVPFSFTLHTSVTAQHGFERSCAAHCSAAARIRAVSYEVADTLERFAGPAVGHKVEVIHLGVAIPKEAKAVYRAGTPLRIITPAQFVPHKAHYVAVQAARALVDAGITNFVWEMIGDGPTRPDVDRQVRALGLQRHVSFPGVLEHKTLLARYEEGEVDVVVLSSARTGRVQEGVPVSLMEAMSFGIPVIATSSGGTDELVGVGEGILVPQGDVAALVEALAWTVRNRDGAREMGVWGRRKAMRSFNADISARRLADFFKRDSAKSAGRMHPI